MKIVIFSGIQKPTSDLPYNHIVGTPALYSYYLRKEFDKLGIETVPCRCPSIVEDDKAYQSKFSVPEGDHILSVEQRGWFLRERCPSLIEKVKKSISGKITTICDNNTIIGEEDYLFYAIPAPKRDKSIYVGWAADGDLLYPEKEKGTLRILIDHSYYGYCARDLSIGIVDNVIKFAKSYKDKVVIRRFISGGIETVNPNEEPKRDIYSRSGLPYLEACEEYRKADIFCVTHPESLGLSVIESAMAGAYVVAPYNHIKKPLLESLHHYEFTKEIPWEFILQQQLNPELSRYKASSFTWDKVAKRIARTLQ